MSPTVSIPFQSWPDAIKTRWRLGLLCRVPRWSPITEKRAMDGYGLWLAWGQQRGFFDEHVAPEKTCTADRLRCYVGELQTRLKPNSVHARVKALKSALSVLAPDMDYRFVGDLLRQLPRTADLVRKRGRLQDQAALLQLGLDLMADAEQGVHASAHKNAVVFRDGLALALRALRPLRPKNFAEIEIGVHLIHANGTWYLDFAPHETKQRRAHSTTFPCELVPYLERYLEKFRPLLTGTKYTGSRLWVSYLFGPLTQAGAYYSVVKRTGNAFGRPVNPNLFRDTAMTSLAMHSPAMVRVGSVVLGHSNLSTGERYYCHAQAIEAGRKLAATLERMRCRGRRSPAKRVHAPGR